MWPKNAYFAVIVKIVCKTLFSEEIRVFYGKTMFQTNFYAEFSIINIVWREGERGKGEGERGKGEGERGEGVDSEKMAGNLKGVQNGGKFENNNKNPAAWLWALSSTAVTRRICCF